MAQVHQAAQSFTEDEWEDIRARVKADEELTQKLQAEERDKYSEVDQARMLQLKRYTFDELKELFETIMKRVNTFTPIESDDTVPNVVAGSLKRDAKQELNQESSKRQKIEKSNYGGLFMKDSSSTKTTEVIEIELWVELKRLFEPDDDDILWKLQRYMHDPLKWRLYDTCAVHHVSTERGHDIFMLVEKDYPLTKALMTLMLSNKLQVDEYSVMADELLRKIFILANRPRQFVLLVVLLLLLTYIISIAARDRIQVLPGDVNTDQVTGYLLTRKISCCYIHTPLEMKYFVTTVDLYYYCWFIFLLLRFIFLIVRNGGQFEYWKAGLVVCWVFPLKWKLPIPDKPSPQKTKTGSVVYWRPPDISGKATSLLSNGYLLNQADKCVYSKFDESGKGVIICLYVDDMLIFGTDQVQVELTKEFLSSRFSMKDMREADVILCIRIKHESNEISISQSHYIEKVLKKSNYFDCTPVSTPMDTSEKLIPNNGQAVSQLEYSRVIGSLMYAMTYTRLDIVFVVGKLSRYTSNPGTQHWQAIQRVLKYLKKTMGYRLTYTGYPSVLKGYIDASWISNTKHNSSTSGWVFLLGGGAISWASKKQTCITGSTIESEFVALAAAGKESECAATLAKAYSQMYNGKSKHLGVRHSMIRELITNGVISIEFVRSQQNLADHLTKGLARDLVIKSAEGMGLNGLKHMYLHIIPRMCLEPAEKEDEVFTSQWLISLKKCLAGA
ncbi:zinc finger, CCHC-type containing protein [Tanacetum coccineum]